MTARDIIAEVARLRKVEEIVKGVIRRDTLTPTDKDGCQLIYEYLLRYDEDRIVELWDRGELGFFIHGIARRQFLGSRSTHYYAHRNFTNKNDGPPREL